MGSYFYIYGVSLTYPYDVPGDAVNVYLARATQATLPYYNQWEFLRVSGSFAAWQAIIPTSPSELWIVAPGAVKHFSVHNITINGTSAWLMVQRHKWGSDHLLIRIADGVWGGVLWNGYWLADQSNMLKTIGNDASGFDVPCDPGTAVTGVYHQTGHWELSDQANDQLLISYYCPRVNHNQEPGHNVTPWRCVNTSANYWRGTSPTTTVEGRIRFYNQDLTKIRPWCTAGEPACDMP